MAKAKQKSVASIKTKRLKSEQSHLHFAMTAKNYSIIGLGIIVIIVGYFLMDANSVDGFMPTVVAPILLVVGSVSYTHLDVYKRQAQKKITRRQTAITKKP